jgi:hypothetical protein
MISFQSQLLLIILANLCLVVACVVIDVFFPRSFDRWTQGGSVFDEFKNDFVPDWRLFYNIFGQETVSLVPVVLVNRYYSTQDLKWPDATDLHSALPVLLVTGVVFWINAVGIRVMPNFINSALPDRIAFRYQMALTGLMISSLFYTGLSLSNQSIYTYFLPMFFLVSITLVDTLYDLTPCCRETKMEAEDFNPVYFSTLHLLTIQVARFTAIVAAWFFGFYTGTGPFMGHLIVMATLTAQLSHDL